jgi:hypothetical protein
MSGPSSRVTYVPERLAVVGTIIDIEGSSLNPWRVERTYFSVTDERPAAMQEIRHHRQATGDALPKP